MCNNKELLFVYSTQFNPPHYPRPFLPPFHSAIPSSSPESSHVRSFPRQSSTQPSWRRNCTPAAHTVPSNTKWSPNSCKSLIWCDLVPRAEHSTDEGTRKGNEWRIEKSAHSTNKMGRAHIQGRECKSSSALLCVPLRLGIEGLQNQYHHPLPPPDVDRRCNMDCRRTDRSKFSFTSFSCWKLIIITTSLPHFFKYVISVSSLRIEGSTRIEYRISTLDGYSKIPPNSVLCDTSSNQVFCRHDWCPSSQQIMNRYG